MLYFSEKETDVGKTSEKKLDLLKQKFLLPKLYEKIKNINLDYDPIINGQDIDPNWKKSLKITYVAKSNLYEVCTVSGYDNIKYCTTLRVEKTTDGYKIYDIEVNDIESILKYSNDDEYTKETDNVKTSYSANGEWRINCGDGVASINIKDKEAFLVVLSNQVYIELAETKRFDFEKGIAYRLSEIPEDKGSFGAKLSWKDYLNDQTIAYVKVVDENTLKFYWYGFYNKNTKRRELTDSEFNQESKSTEVILKKCSSE